MILPDYFLMISHLDSHTTTDVKPEMLSRDQIGNRIPNDEFNIRRITHAHTYRKDDKGPKTQEFCTKGATITKNRPKY